NFNIDNFLNDGGTNPDQCQPYADHRPAAQTVFEHFTHVAGVDHIEEKRQTNRQEADQQAGDASLRGQYADLTLQFDTLADRTGDHFQKFGEITADFTLNVDRSDHEVKVITLDTGQHMLHRVGHIDAKLNFLHDALELAFRRFRGIA